MAGTNPTSPDRASPRALAADLMVLPWDYAQAVHAMVEGSCRLWAHMFLPSAYPPHPHEAESQLEIPDPIAAELEQDLFA